MCFSILFELTAKLNTAVSCSDRIKVKWPR